MKILDSTQPGFKEELVRFRQRGGTTPPEIVRRVEEIVARVREEGDSALFDLTRRFDGITLNPETVEVTEEEMAEARSRVESAARTALRASSRRIRSFHRRQVQESWTVTDEAGVTLGQIVRPLDRVGIYVPGGKAAYPSSVLMNAVPARVAGVAEIIMVTPAPQGSVNPHVLAAAEIAGVDRIFKVGGAQAVAALAYGTACIPRVDKIVGPGNIYVALAKKQVFGIVDIDMIAGPSEILVLADHTAVPDFVAADLLSQAEHDEMAWPILVTPAADLIPAVERALQQQLRTLPRREIAQRALDRYGTMVRVRDLLEGVDVVNAIGPEHLEILVEEPQALLEGIQNAGAVFLGAYSPEPIGDYMAGPNHVLPTGGTTRFFSPLNVGDFYKRSSLIAFSRKGFEEVADQTVLLAELEGLPGHARAVRLRREKEGAP